MDVAEWFAEVWADEVQRRSEHTDYPPESWRASGRASKAWPDKEDESWWFAHGPGFIETWRNWRDAVGWPIWVPVPEMPDMPAIELDLKVGHPDYDFEMRSITDRVFVHDSGALVVVDIKSGTFKPPVPLQLAVNAECIERSFGIRPAYGVFFEARKGGYSTLWDLNQWSSEFLWDRAAKARKIRDLELFTANPSNLCSSCSVKDFCHTMRGGRAHEFPPHYLPLEEASE